MGVHIVCLSLSFEVTQWLRWQGGMPFATFRVQDGVPPGSSPNGSKIASGSGDKTVIIWDAATGDKVSELKGHSGSVTSVAWSPEGTHRNGR